jgi:hypothetical protein
MKLRAISGIFLIFVMFFPVFSAVHADSGPNVAESQAKAIAQDYLNSHNLPYTAVMPTTTDNWKAKVKVVSTGETKWIPFGNYKMDAMDGTGKYEYITNAWIVEVNDKNGKNVGNIYINPENGSIMSVNLSGSQNDGSGGSSSGGSSGDSGLTYNGNGTGGAQNGQGFFDGIIKFFQQLWISIFGGK